MKKIIIACLLCMTTAVMSADTFWEDVKVNGSTRKMLVHIPEDLPKGAPLVISCHGMNQDPNYQCNTNSKWTAVADTAKFALVFPQGNNNSWDISGTGDIKFMKALIEQMKEEYDINLSRVYLSGFSMGGMFTYHCANKAPELFAAFVPVSGYPMWDKTVTSERPVPILHVHGTGDDVCVFSGVQPTLDNWIKRNECNPNPEIIKPYPSNKKSSGATLTKWTGGLEGVEVQLLQFKDKGHWQSEDPSSCLTSVEAWKFMKRWSLTPKVQKMEPEENSFDLPLDGNEITLTFDMDVEADGAEAILAGNGNEIKLEVKGSGKELSMALPLLEQGEYTLTVNNVKGENGEVLKSFTAKLAFGYEEVTEIPSGKFEITEGMTLAQIYKGRFLYTIREAKELYESIPENKRKKYTAVTLKELIEKYESFTSTSPSAYEEIIAKFTEAISKAAGLSGVDELIEGEVGVALKEYYNLQGVRIDRPAEGIVIERIVFDDGSEKMVKKVNR